MMNTVFFVALAAICGLSSSATIFNEGRTFFKHREKPVERRSPLMSEDARSLQDLKTRWFKRYYHGRNREIEPSESFPKYKYDSPESLQWLMENILETAQNSKEFSPVQNSINPLKTDEPQPQAISDENENDALEYSDVYGMTSMLNNQDPVDPSFQQALSHYMQSNNQKENELKSRKVENPEVSIKQASVDHKTEADVATSSPSTIASSVSYLLSETTISPVSPTAASNSLSAIPPVHLGKGQKEYAMLRPASENTRKFENWAENFQKSLMGQSKDIEQMLHVFDDSNFAKDRFEEQLDKLKIRSRRDVNADDIILY